MRLLRVIVLGVCVGVTAWNSQALEKRSMTLADCIEEALHHNLDVKIKRANPEIARYNLGAVYGAWDPVLTLSGAHSYNSLPGSVDAQGRPFSGTQNEGDTLSGGLQGLTPWGMTYSAGANVTDTTGSRPSTIATTNITGYRTNVFFDTTTTNSTTFLSPVFATDPFRAPFQTTDGTLNLFQVRQPLLRNFWIDSTRLQILIDRKNLTISELDLRNQMISSLTEVEKAYYDLISAQENVRTQQKALELADRQLTENKKRVEVGAMAPLDEKQAQSQAAQSRADLLQAEGAEQTQQRVLKGLISDDYEKWGNVSIIPAEKLVAIPEQFNLQESWRKGMSMRPDLLQQKLNLEKQGYVIRYQRNQLFPELDLVGNYGFNSSGREFSGALDQFAGRDNPFWSYGAQLSIPLTQTAARNNYKAAKASRDQIVLQYKQIQQQVLIQIEDAIAAVNTQFQRAAATREARTYAEAALEAEQKKLESGKSTSFVVLQLQKNLTTARLDEIRALSDYNNALAQVAFREGSTLDRRHITLEFR